MSNEPQSTPQPKPSIFSVLTPYRPFVVVLIVIAVAMNSVSLVIPKLISRAIDAFLTQRFDPSTITMEFVAVALGIAILTYLQGVVQTYTSERVARDLRNTLTAKISNQSFAYIQEKTPSQLLTNLTSDIDAIKLFVSQAIVTMVSSLIIIIGSALLLLSIQYELAIVVLCVLPAIGFAFALTLSRVRPLFTASQQVIDWLNKVINESILGAALIRVVNARATEEGKFTTANAKAKDVSMTILALFAGLIPIISFVASFATLVILFLGGHLVIGGGLSLGDFAAFNSYVALMIFPILMIGMMSNVIARATTSYERIVDVLNAPEVKDTGTRVIDICGDIDVQNVTVMFGEKYALKDVSLSIKAGTKTAILGPTAAGKTQLLYALIGLINPQEGLVLYDGVPMKEYEKVSFYRQIGLVFQESIMFNVSVRENIAFAGIATEADVAKAITTAELGDFVSTLPQGLDSIVSERGTSLSGGQKQRIMLARALALNPKILFLDDFTARVDAKTEQKIVANIASNYPGTTIVSVTQTIAPIQNYDQIVLVMEGEILAKGTHEALMRTSPEYVQMVESQQSTSAYEL